ncbi:gluconokinase [Parafrigoribacterium mesophilum]|uniref:gluconokinase n=1 Tax=Parafrigoribacterium mesophilum TaxID=433646 RepID=UPI0031FDCEAF
MIVMGVQGSGKSTIGTALARKLDVPFVDGDSLHSAENIRLMASGHALTDEERLPWLQAVGERLAGAGDRGVVVACSALKRSYRDLLREHAPDMATIYAKGDIQLIRTRISGRHHDYMPTSLLQSQFDTLEERDSDEPGITVDIGQTPAQIVERIAEFLTRRPAEK